jgi:membrane peptidoglycan carboxypeptidase
LAVALAACLAAAAWGLRTWAQLRGEGLALAQTHRALLSFHKGFSYPAHVYSQAVPVDAGIWPRRLLAEAALRGYPIDCSVDAGPGTRCERPARVLPRDGALLEPIELGVLLGPDAELRTHLPLAQAPQALLDLIVTSEDRDFFGHSGVNTAALARAFFTNVKEQAYAQGASTLSMQVVRALSQRTEKRALRKLQEMAKAQGLDAALGKQGVFQLYLDLPYLGQRSTGLAVCGFAEGARHYFGVDVRQASLAQLALLVAILPAPAKLAPDVNLAAAMGRRDGLLKLLAQHKGYDVTAALAEPIRLSPQRPLPERFPSYLQAVRAHLERTLSAQLVTGAGLRVTTAVDTVLQDEAERLFEQKAAAYEVVLGIKARGSLQVAGAAIDVDTGALISVMGGRGAKATSFNRATQALRQPGSSFKPVVYALAFSQRTDAGLPRYNAGSTQGNMPRAFYSDAGVWRPYNVSGESSQTVALAEGLVWSHNIATASLLEHLGGPETLIPFARRTGFDTTHFAREPGLALGQAEVTPLQLTQFMAELANGGKAVSASPVLSAIDVFGQERLSPPALGETVIDPTASALTRDLMRLVIEYGTGGASRGVQGEAGYTGPAMGKTGTTDSERDVWFAGSTPRTAAVVWLGFDQPARVGAAASDLAAPLWGWWLGRANLQAPWPDFSPTPKLIREVICAETGKRPNDTCRALPAPFTPGTQPTAVCTVEHPADTGVVRESLWKRRARLAAEADGGNGP